MKKHIRNIAIFILPFLIMVIINELVRVKIKERPYTAHGITAINSVDKVKNKCTWICHNQTNYCKLHHVKFDKKWFVITDNIYFGTIKLLQSTGNYGLANIIFFVVLFPLIIWFLIIRSLDIQIEINNLKKNQKCMK